VGLVTFLFVENAESKNALGNTSNFSEQKVLTTAAMPSATSSGMPSLTMSTTTPAASRDEMDTVTVPLTVELLLRLQREARREKEST
jgi:hypothetical protein